MHWKKSFPGKYLQVSDLDAPIVATIASTQNENVGAGEDAEPKLVVHFHEPEVKALVCNLTRAEAIAAIAGSEDTDGWPGTTIQIVRGTTTYKGKRVACLAVEAPPKAAAKARKAAPAPNDDEPLDEPPLDAYEVGY